MLGDQCIGTEEPIGLSGAQVDDFGVDVVLGGYGIKDEIEAAEMFLHFVLVFREHHLVRSRRQPLGPPYRSQRIERPLDRRHLDRIDRDHGHAVGVERGPRDLRDALEQPVVGQEGDLCPEPVDHPAVISQPPADGHRFGASSSRRSTVIGWWIVATTGTPGSDIMSIP